ncbi:MAG TPA: lysylphosphatidylglycerol synthase transmembrane domain-containing protein [Anaerolineales bacterium]
MRKFIIAIALLLGIVFVLAKLAEVQAIIGTLKQGELRYVLLALVVEAAWIVNVAALYRAIYRAMGLQENTKKLILLSSAAYFVNVVAPSGVGMGGIAVLISEARRQGYSSGRVIMAGVLYVLFDYTGFLCVLALGLLVLARRNNLNSPELVASVFLFLVALALALVIWSGMYSADALGRVLCWAARWINRVLRPFIHREYLSEKRANLFAREASDGLHQMRRRPHFLFAPALLTLTSKGLLVLVLSLMFLSFQIPFSAGTLIAGFSIGYLFMLVSPTPAGIGVVEGMLTLALGSLHVPIGAATVVALSYRGITFWAPLLVGMLSFRWVSHGRRIEMLPQMEDGLTTRPDQATPEKERNRI